MEDEQGHGARLTGASVSNMSAAEPTPGESPRPMSRFGPWIAAIWLFFLLDPIVAGWQDRNHVEGALGIVSTVAFGTVYLALWVRGRQDRARLIEHPPLRVSLVWLGVLIALGVAMVVLLGEPGIACSVYVAIAGVLVFPFRAAAPLSLSIVVIVLALGSLADWSSQIGTAFGVMAASVAIFGLRQVLARNLDLIKAHQENAQLAVESERNRFARDLHDVLGHSLTVITVKAELAGRVFDSDPERARTELADLERLSRDALADMRRAVGAIESCRCPVSWSAPATRSGRPRSTPSCPTPPTRSLASCRSCSPGPFARGSPTSSGTVAHRAARFPSCPARCGSRTTGAVPGMRPAQGMGWRGCASEPAQRAPYC